MCQQSHQVLNLACLQSLLFALWTIVVANKMSSTMHRWLSPFPGTDQITEYVPSGRQKHSLAHHPENSYWAHEENVLLAMLADDDLASHQAAIDRIKAIHQAPVSTQQQVREFLLPKVDQSVETPTDLLSQNAPLNHH